MIYIMGRLLPLQFTNQACYAFTTNFPIEHITAALFLSRIYCRNGVMAVYKVRVPLEKRRVDGVAFADTVGSCSGSIRIYRIIYGTARSLRTYVKQQMT